MTWKRHQIVSTEECGRSVGHEHRSRPAATWKLGRIRGSVCVLEAHSSRQADLTNIALDGRVAETAGVEDGRAVWIVVTRSQPGRYPA